MILTTASSASTQRLNGENAAILKTSTTVERDRECGCHCTPGFDDKGRINVKVHANSEREIEVGLAKP